MTKAQIIDQVYLAVNGGKPTQDTDTQRADIASLLDAAIDLAAQNLDQVTLLNSMRMARISGVFPEYTNRVMVTYDKEILIDEQRGLPYFTLPALPVQSARQAALDVQPKKGAGQYIYAKTQSQVSSVPDCMGLVYYWAELVNKEVRVYFKNLGYPVCNHIVQAVMPISAIPDDQEMGLNHGLEMLAIDIMVSFFRGQRVGPRDLTMDQTDNNAQG